MAFAKTLEGFVTALTSSSVSSEALNVLTEEEWDDRKNWSREQWEYWQTWGWFRQFARYVSAFENINVSVGDLIDDALINFQYARQLKSNQVTFEAGPLAGLEILSDKKSPGRQLFAVWCLAIGRLE